jgi:hypothetical protein
MGSGKPSVLGDERNEEMPDIDHTRNEIERMRIQVGRQRKEILQLQRGWHFHGLGRGLLERMLNKIDTLCAERDKLRTPEPRDRQVLGGRKW